MVWGVIRWKKHCKQRDGTATFIIGKDGTHGGKLDF